MNLRTVLRTLHAHWILAAAVAGGCVAVALLVTLFATPQFVSTTRVFVALQSSGSAAEMYQGNNFAQQRIRSYADVATRPIVLDKVVQRSNLDESSERLSRRIKVTVQPDTVVITLAVKDPNPQQATLIARNFSTAFVETVAELEKPADKPVSPVRASIVEPATEPVHAASPRMGRTVLLALLAGLILGVAAAYIRSTLDTRISDLDDLRDVVDLPVLGTIPEEAHLPGGALASVADPLGVRAEAIRHVRTNLQFVNVGHAPRSLTVTSAVPGEGKTTTACNLAVALAEAGHRVCLVGADLRRPSEAQVFGIEGNVGLTTVLIGQATLEEVLQPWGTQNNLAILPSGQIPPNPSELLGSPQMKQVLTDLAQQFDVTIVDAPPVLPVTDAVVVSQATDGVLFVVAADKSNRHEISRAVEVLRATGTEVVGAVLNNAKRSSHGAYGYGSYIAKPEQQPQRLETSSSLTETAPVTAPAKKVPQPRAAQSSARSAKTKRKANRSVSGRSTNATAQTNHSTDPTA